MVMGETRARFLRYEQMSIRSEQNEQLSSLHEQMNKCLSAHGLYDLTVGTAPTCRAHGFNPYLFVQNL